MAVHLIDLRGDVLVYSVLFNLYTSTFVMLNCLIVLFSFLFCGIQVTQRAVFISCIYYY